MQNSNFLLCSRYVDGVLYQLDRFITKHGDKGKQELNTIASARTITMDLDEDRKILLLRLRRLCYGISRHSLPRGISRHQQLTTPARWNTLGECSQRSAYFWPVTSPSASLRAQAESIKRQLGEIPGRDVALSPRSEQAFDKLSAGDGDALWQRNLGAHHAMY